MAGVEPLRALHYDLGKVGALADVAAPPYDVIDDTQRAELAERSPYNVVELVRPRDRTQPGPKEDRLRLTRATRHNLSPIFSLAPDDAWPLLEPALDDDPWGEATDAERTTHRVWRIGDPEVHRAVGAELADGELLIADGHHRYETALTYAREVGGGNLDGNQPHNFVLMALVSLEDPGLTVFATHRLLKDLSQEQREGIRDAAKQEFEPRKVTAAELIPAPEDPPGSFGYMDAHHLQPWRLTPKGSGVLDGALAGHSSAYRRVDADALEAVFLKGAVGLSDEDIAAKKQLAYTPGAEEAVHRLEAREVDAAFFLRPTPVGQVREVAAAGETMPP